MNITTVLLYSDSCLYRCLAYICNTPPGIVYRDITVTYIHKGEILSHMYAKLQYIIGVRVRKYVYYIFQQKSTSTSLSRGRRKSVIYNT